LENPKKEPVVKKTNFTNVSQLSLTLSSIDVQEMLLARAKSAVLQTAVALMEQDMERLCGSRFSRKAHKDLCHRGGSEMTSLIVDGAKYPVRRPRARKGSEEVELPSLVKMRDRELLDSQMLNRVVRGVSTRNYEDVISGFAEKTGVAKSSVSRAFKRASKKDLDAINSEDLSSHRFVAILIDGTGVGETTQVVAVGVTDDSRKVPLGLREGDTENAGVVKDLLTSIIARGFTLAGSRLLAVLDGGKALRSAVKAIWGDAVLIQRCWIHKLRNIKDYIPEVNHGQLWKRMKRIMGVVDQRLAERELELLADWLHTINPDAVMSLKEAGSELLTVHRLGLTGSFRNSLSSTNIIESLIGIAKTKMKNVRNWNYHPKTGPKVPRDKAQRWVAMAIQSHREKMNRVHGGKEQMPTLINKLNLLDQVTVSA
jgi:putative transposase